ncbi:S-layer homology domain-containing protein [Paenisporosarcina quisquiliarum]|uniref:S-layer homology domain-containing protein n=1 Tax=Paenisporosarcina quisquiliarum TaxID=365346 RepID=A0A9X3LEU2_9BACL|nr:S-layer homology domain-containing protein [Paenisporosarcina quisquiliarum]MCZ8536636.1 S-layer homology domain-containing protein [Paenisporosarcina quisquiliarum]
MAYQPKSYKKFVATAATATLVASAIAPAASAAFSDVAERYQEAVTYLADKGISQGYPNGKFGTDDNIKRQDAAVMIAKALGGSPTGTYANAGFTDVPADRQWAVNFLVEKNIVSGKAAGQFGANDFTTRGEMAKIIANAYKFVADASNAFPFTDVSETFKQYVDALNEAGVAQGYAGTTQFGTGDLVTRGQFALFVYRAETKNTPTVTSVVDVKAENAKTITVTFNNAIDAKTLQNSNKVDLITVVSGDKAANPGTITQSLSADGKTLTLDATTFFKGDYTVKVPYELIKDVNGKFVSPVNQKITVDDKSAPVLESATATVADTKNNIKKITLTFDENIESIDTVKIGGLNYPATYSGNTATVDVDLDATKSYDVTVVNATDVVNNIKDVQVVKLALTVDNIAPSVTSVVATGENTATVTVDKALKNNNLVVTGKVGAFATNIVTSAVVNPKNNKEYFVTFNAAYLFKNGNTDAVTLTVAKEALEDSLGNKNTSEITKSVVLTKDAVAPSVSKVTSTTKDGKVTGFTVTFSEKVQTLDASKVKVVNSKGEILSYPSVASAAINAEDATKVDFTFDANLKADKYSFEFAEGFVKDLSLAQNKNTVYSFTVDKSSTTAPVETAFTIAGTTTVANSNVITVDFGAKVKATGTGSALNPASYQLNGTSLPTNAEVKFAGNVGDASYQTIVNITLPEGFVVNNDDKAIFRVTGVQTLDNKVNNPYTALVAVKDNASPEAKSFVATDLTKLTVTYSEAVALVAGNSSITDEIQLFDSKGAYIAITGSEVTNGKLVLTVADATAVTKLTTVKVDPTAADIKDVNGNVQKSALTLTK